MESRSRPGDATREPVILYPSRGKLAGLLALSLLLVAGSVLSIKRDLPGGWPGALFFGLCALVFLIQFHPRSSYLRLNREGFIVCSLFRQSPLVPWRDVGPFQVAKIPRARRTFVVYEWNTKKHPTLQAISRSIAGTNAALPDTYGLRAEQLADLLNEWRTDVLAP